MLTLPEFSDQHAGEEATSVYEAKAGGTERLTMVGKMGDAEAGEQSEGEVEDANQEGGGVLERTGRDAELGDEPEGARRGAAREPVGKVVNFRLGEAVQEEVGDKEVGRSLRGEAAGVGVHGQEAVCVEGGVMTQEAEHGFTGIDRSDVDVWVGAEQTGGETSVPVAEDEGIASSCKRALAQEVEAGALEQAAEGEVFEPAIERGNVVEVGGLVDAQG